MSDPSEFLGSVSRALGWLVLLLYFAMGIVALARLKTTPAGLLIGGGLLVEVIASVTMRVVRMIVVTPETLGDAEYTQIYAALSLTSTAVHMLFTLLLAVGFALLPSSLAKLGHVSDRIAGVHGDRASVQS